MRRRGTTLIEVLIAAGLFLLSLILCGQLSVLGMRSQSTTVDKNQAFRWATAGVDQLNRDLAHTTQIYLPVELSDSKFVGTAAHPGGPQVFHPVATKPLVVQSSSINGGPTVVGYWWDSTNSTLTRVPYDPNYTIASHSVLSGQQPKAIATWVTDFSIYGVDVATQYGTKTLEAQLVLSTVAPGNPGPNVTLQALTRLRML